jgi:hypothetical protein
LAVRQVGETAMNPALPYWIQVLQALLTPAIAGAVAVIALFQWRTAQHKVVLDLFDRRMETYTSLRNIVTKVIGSSSAATTEISFEFHRAMHRAEFLFGDEIGEHLKRIDAAINEIRIVLAERNGLQVPELTASINRERLARAAVESFSTTVHVLVKPYVRMQQKLSWLLVSSLAKTSPMGSECTGRHSILGI